MVMVGCRYDHFDVCMRKVLSQLSSSNAPVARQVCNVGIGMCIFAVPTPRSIGQTFSSAENSGSKMSGFTMLRNLDLLRLCIASFMPSL